MMENSDLQNPLYHVMYEIYMYLYTLQELYKSDEEQIEYHNILVESNLLHLRSLVDFYNNKEFYVNKNTKKKIKNIEHKEQQKGEQEHEKENDNIVVKSFINNAEFKIDIGIFKYKNHEIKDIDWISKTIQHISKGRLDGNMFEIRDGICNKYKEELRQDIVSFIKEIQVEQKVDNYNETIKEQIIKIESLLKKLTTTVETGKTVNSYNIKKMTDNYIFTTTSATEQIADSLKIKPMTGTLITTTTSATEQIAKSYELGEDK